MAGKAAARQKLWQRSPRKRSRVPASAMACHLERKRNSKPHFRHHFRRLRNAIRPPDTTWHVRSASDRNSDLPLSTKITTIFLWGNSFACHGISSIFKLAARKNQTPPGETSSYRCPALETVPSRSHRAHPCPFHEISASSCTLDNFDRFHGGGRGEA